MFRWSLTAARVAGFLLVAFATSCSPSSEAPEPPPSPALWRITDQDSTIWLFGTVHMLPEGFAWRSAEVDAAFAAADELVVETDTSAAAQQSIATLAQKHGALPAGQRLSSLIDGASRARLARICAELGLNPEALENTRPWLAGLMLSVAYAEKLGHRAEHGVEAALLAEAAAASKTVSFLESGEQQIRALADLSEADETAFFVASLEDIESDQGSLAEIDALWARGDVDGLSRTIEDEMRDRAPAAYEALITRRNENWTAQITERLGGEGEIFVAVGAAHLAGPDSVVAMLRARGVTVEGP